MSKKCKMCGNAVKPGNTYCADCENSLSTYIEVVTETADVTPELLCMYDLPRGRSFGINGLRRNLRGQGSWHTISGVLYVVLAILTGAAAVLGATLPKVSGSTAILAFIAGVYALFACANFIYANRLKQYANVLPEYLLLEQCVSPIGVVMGMLFCIPAMVYAIMVCQQARKFQ